MRNMDQLPEERRDSYVYVIFRPNGVPCYVGKGTGKRWTRDDRRSRNPHFGNIVRNSAASLPRIKVQEDLTNDAALKVEIALILAIGREDNGGPLVNLTDGGEGTVGAKMSVAWCANRSVKAAELWKDPLFRSNMIKGLQGNSYSKKPHNLSLEWRQQLTQKMLGNTNTLGSHLTEEHKALISSSQKGRLKSATHRAAIGRAQVGKLVSQETRKKLSLAGKGRIVSEATRPKLSMSTRCVPKSSETRARMKEAWARRRLQCVVPEQQLTEAA